MKALHPARETGAREALRLLNLYARLPDGSPLDDHGLAVLLFMAEQRSAVRMGTSVFGEAAFQDERGDAGPAAPHFTFEGGRLQSLALRQLREEGTDLDALPDLMALTRGQVHILTEVAADTHPELLAAVNREAAERLGQQPRVSLVDVLRLNPLLANTASHLR